MITGATKEIGLLHRLARSYEVEVEYEDYTGRRRQAGPQALLAALRGLGAPVRDMADLADGLRIHRREQCERACEPVVVAWDGSPALVDLRLPAQAPARVEGRLELENGEERRLLYAWEELPLLEAVTVDGARFERRRLFLPAGLPRGYHRLHLDLGRRFAAILVIAAASRVYEPGGDTHLWGVFLPLYALNSGRSWGAGDYTGLKELARWTADLGGRVVGTLPLTPAFYNQPFAASPYQPVSRLFWNEFYLDVDRVEELTRSPGAQKLLAAPEFRREQAALRAAATVDYRRIMALKRQILEICARNCFAEDGGRLAALREWVGKNGAVADYARFRATVESRGTVWQEWPGRLADGDLREGDYHPQAARYHLYVQWLAHRQLGEAAQEARARGRGLYLDLPVGVHPSGYDVWRERAVFVPDMSTGAPPDALFAGGQDWRFPPLHPQAIREQGYRYYIACLGHHLRQAGVLRLDHVMGLHRLYWVPAGTPAGEGVYVRYRAGEFYAVLSLESHRHQAVIVGEDLGTVPAYVRRAMARHRLHRMYVLPFQVSRDPGAALNPVPARCLASLNTHDMPPFASFWAEEKKKNAAWPLYLCRAGYLARPTNNAGAVSTACLAYLAASRARFVQVNLEDLWLETLPQNVPGTTDEVPNWRRKTRYSWEEICRLPRAARVLGEVNRLRNARRIRGRERT